MIRALLAVALTATVAAAQVGEPLPQLEYKDFTQTEAKSISDFGGRLILVEVFAHW